MSALAPVSSVEDTSLLGRQSGHAESDRMRPLVDHLKAAGQRSTAEMLSELRRAFPDSPLSQRVAALEALRRHIPR
jgi:hypothetical protein